MRGVNAFGDDALGELDAVALVDAIRTGRVSPAEVVDAAIARCEAVNPTLNGLAHESFDQAQARARSSNRPGGYFDGVPTFFKDNVDVEGMPTMNGTDAWEPVPKLGHGEFARFFLGTGLIPLGKTQLSEFGFSAAAEHPRIGAVRNPWDTEYTAGASSSGSGAFVAAGVVPIAHANDGGGSIRIPAACNGLVGLKPSRGRLPQDEMSRKMPVRLVNDGGRTRSVRDTAAFYRESERIWRNRSLLPNRLRKHRCRNNRRRTSRLLNRKTCSTFWPIFSGAVKPARRKHLPPPRMNRSLCAWPLPVNRRQPAETCRRSSPKAPRQCRQRPACRPIGRFRPNRPAGLRNCHRPGERSPNRNGSRYACRRRRRRPPSPFGRRPPCRR